MNIPIEIYIRPQCAPAQIHKAEDVRIYYNGTWVDFRHGTIRISQDHDHAYDANEEDLK